MTRKTQPATLDTYRAKRRFDTTAEPRGDSTARSKGPRSKGQSFVVQKHAARRLHYDFRLELNGVLKSWAVTRGPSYNLRDKRLAVRVEDHPLDYAGFEGTIPQGEYGGGTVMVWDRGQWQPDGDPEAGLAAGKIAFTLAGEKLHGRWALVRMRADPKSKRENWLLIKEKDEFANQGPDVLDQALSVATGRSLDQIAAHAPAAQAAAAKAPKPKKSAGKPPTFVPPALATLTDKLPTDAGWMFEIKYDGYRAQIAVDGERVTIFSRSGLDWTDRFAPIAAAVAGRRFDRALLDSEIVVLDPKGRSDFGRLQHWLETGEGTPACYVFDVLAEAGKDLRTMPQAERRRRLLALVPETATGPLYPSALFEPDDPAPLFAETCHQGLEGLIAKRSDAPYPKGRTASWLKIKCGHQQEFVVIGWATSTRRAFSSLLLGVNEGGKLRYAGRVGSGFSDALLADLAARFEAMTVKSPAVAVPPAVARTARFVAPQIVVEVRFAGWTRDNLVRQGTVLGIREDKPAKAVTREVPDQPATGPCQIAGIPISHPDKPLFQPGEGRPAATKAELAAYLDQVGPVMARYAADRFISLLRAPRGGKGQGFFQRHKQAGLDRYWQSRTLDDAHEAYMFFSDPRALVEAAQMDALEFHIWGSRIDQQGKPDRIVFDLDPAPDVDFEAVKRGARDVRDVLHAVGLESMPLLSGGKGIHVVVPIRPRTEWQAVKRFSAAIAGRLATADPDRYVATMTKSKRTGRIFIDHFRNDRSASAVSPFSPRNRPGAPVAWPTTWESLDDHATAASIGMNEALERLADAGDPWQGTAISQSLTARMMEAASQAPA